MDNTINTKGGRPLGKVQLFPRVVFNLEIVWMVCRGGSWAVEMELMVRLVRLKIPENDSSSISASRIVLLIVFSNKSARFNRFYPRSEIDVWLLHDRANEHSHA